MNTLQQRALARLPLSVEQVQRQYETTMCRTRTEKAVKDLCESHERLRAEVQGLEIMRDSEPRILSMLKRVVKAANSVTGHDWDADPDFTPALEDAMRLIGSLEDKP